MKSVGTSHQVKGAGAPEARTCGNWNTIFQETNEKRLYEAAVLGCKLLKKPEGPEKSWTSPCPGVCRPWFKQAE